jgi:hypothetical protein
MAFRPNRGECPPECIVRDDDGNITGFRRVHVRLRGGYTTVGREPSGWLSSGRGGCRWTIRNDPFDITEYEVI